MKKITGASIRQQLVILNNRYPGDKFYMDHCGMGWRLMTAKQERNVSPRLTTREMYWWMDGFLEGQRGY